MANLVSQAAWRATKDALLRPLCVVRLPANVLYASSPLRFPARVRKREVFAWEPGSSQGPRSTASDNDQHAARCSSAFRLPSWTSKGLPRRLVLLSSRLTPRTPASMGGYDARQIQNALSSNGIVLRITDDNSITPRTVDGYTASSCTVPSYTSSDEWRQYYQGRYPNWRSLDDQEVDGIVDHITGGWRGYSWNTHSDWISTSASLMWIIWEIARRLDRDDCLEIELAVIRRKFHSGYRGIKPVRLDAAETLRLYYHRTNYNHTEVVNAIRFARASSEVVFFGRIFDKDVLETTFWTLAVSRPKTDTIAQSAHDARHRASRCQRSTSGR